MASSKTYKTETPTSFLLFWSTLGLSLISVSRTATVVTVPTVIMHRKRRTASIYAFSLRLLFFCFPLLIIFPVNWPNAWNYLSAE